MTAIHRWQALKRLGSLTSIAEFIIEYNDSLERMEALTSVTAGIFVTGNSALTDFRGLEHIASIGGILKVVDNESLISFEGLNALTSVDQVILYSNPSIEGLEGLDNVTSLGELTLRDMDSFDWFGSLSSLRSLSIHDVPDVSGLDNIVIENLYLDGVRRLDGLDAITSLGVLSVTAMDDLTFLDHITAIDSLSLNQMNGFEGLDQITSLQTLRVNFSSSLRGLENITSIGDSLYIMGCEGLESFEGLENITSLGRLYVSRCRCLTSLTGLENLASLEEDLMIENNNALESLGLHRLTTVGSHPPEEGDYFSFRVTDNASLCTDRAEALMQQVLTGGTLNAAVTISGNKICP